MTIQWKRGSLVILGGALAIVGCSSADGNQDNQGNVNGNRMEPTCGNGIIEDPGGGLLGFSTSEQCDGTNLGDHTCESLGWEGGALVCSETCKFDTDRCIGLSPCGNGVIDPGELCDGTNIGGATCSSVYDGSFTGSGPVGCNPDCRGFNLTFCHLAVANCGNGIDENYEACDDGEDNSDTRPDACRTNCMYPSCGDGVIDTGEECDDGLRNSNSVPDACRLYCTSDACTCRLAFCGDGVMDTGEECDGRDLGDLGCEDHGFTGGTLACNADCTADTSGCTP